MRSGVITQIVSWVRSRALFDAYRTMAEAFMEVANAGREDDAWRGFVDYWNGTGTWDGMPEKARNRMFSLTRTALAAIRGNLTDPTTMEELDGLQLPTLILCGGETAAPYRRITEILSERLPTCRFVIIPKAAHMSVVTHPEEVAVEVRAHLDRNG